MSETYVLEIIYKSGRSGGYVAARAGKGLYLAIDVARAYSGSLETVKKTAESIKRDGYDFDIVPKSLTPAPPSHP